MGDQLCLFVGPNNVTKNDDLDHSFNGFLLAYRWSLCHQDFQETALGFFLMGVLLNRWGSLPILLGNSSQQPATLGFPWYSSQ